MNTKLQPSQVDSVPYELANTSSRDLPLVTSELSYNTTIPQFSTDTSKFIPLLGSRKLRSSLTFYMHKFTSRGPKKILLVRSKGHGFDSTADMTAIFKDGITINYGFHDAGEGRHDQVYVYLTPDRQNWIGDLIASNPGYGPFVPSIS